MTVVVGGQTLTATVSGATWSVAVPAALADGVYDVRATATDAAGNAASDATTNELTVDTTPPAVTVSTLLAHTSTPTLSGTVADPLPGSGIAGVTVVVGGQTLTATVSGATWSVAVPVGLADGIYNVQATATDKVGNVGVDVTTNELTVDTVHPTDILLSNSTVAEHQPVYTGIGVLSSTGPHSGAYTYALVSGTGSDDNGSFRIVGNLLQTNAIFDFATKSVYNIRIRTTDSLGYSLEKQFTVSVVAEAGTVSVGDSGLERSQRQRTARRGRAGQSPASRWKSSARPAASSAAPTTSPSARPSPTATATITSTASCPA